jgi:4-carboxymuconolactone decarboxylase
MTIRHKLALGVAGLLAAGSFAAIAQTATGLPGDLDPTSRARLPYVDRKDLDAAGQEIFDMLPGRSPDGKLGGPLAFAAYDPPVAKALFDLHNAAVAGTLDAHARELAILVACRETHYDLEWNAHVPAALRAGVDSKIVDVVRARGPLTGVDEQDAVVIRFGRQMLTDKHVNSATFASAVDKFGRRGVMDLVAVMNTYAVSGFYAIAVDEHPPAGTSALELMPK